VSDFVERRRGRPRLPTHRKKTKDLRVSLTEGDHAALEELAVKARYSVSELVRHACRTVLLKSVYSSSSA